MNTSQRADVLVVGAGPVGMTAAILLASHGLRVTIIEKNLDTANDPKAISLDDESLRVYQRAGIASDVLSVIVPGTGTTYFGVDGEPLFHGGAKIPFRFGFPFKNPFAQPDLERVLRVALDTHPLVDVRFGTELVSFSDSPSGGVLATVAVAGEHTEIGAEYILGADGGRSKVRSLLGITMEGKSHDDVWLVIDCLEDGHTQRFGMHHGDPRRPHVIVPGLHGRCRYEFYLWPDEGPATDHPPFELIQAVLAPYRHVEQPQIERAVAYKFHGLNATEWNRGRAFLLGDAAHMMPPFAGQGLNSGIRDAANLTWKIAAVLQAGAPTELLDTYVRERRPHASAVIRSSERLGRVVMTTNVRLATFRDEAVKRAMATAEGRAFFEGMAYRPSPRITDGLVLEESSYAMLGLAIGQPRVFDFQNHRIVGLDDLLGQGWSVLGVGLGDDQSAWSAAMESFSPMGATFVDVPLDDSVRDRPRGVTIAIDVDTQLYSEVAEARGRFVVVRPDRVVAAIASPGALHETAEYFITSAVGGFVTATSV